MSNPLIKSIFFVFYRLNNFFKKPSFWKNYLIGFLVIFIIGLTVGYAVIAIMNNYGAKNSQNFWHAFISSVNDLYSKIVFFGPAAELNSPVFSVEENTVFSEETVISDDNGELRVGVIDEEIISENAGETDELSADLAVQFSLQEDLDDILEEIDIIKSEIEKLEKSSLENSNSFQNDQDDDDNQDDAQQEIDDNSDDNLNNEALSNDILSNEALNNVSSAIGGSVVYPKILISEIQISGTTDEKEEFVELYNPNKEEIMLTDWYLQRKTQAGASYSTFVSNNLFSGKKIGGMEYFIIAREGSSFTVLADIIAENSLGDSDSSSTLVLKNPNRDISDKLGFGDPQEYESSPAKNLEKGKSLGRKWNNDTEQDTDNNSFDFEIQIPTPKARNVVYVAPVVLPDQPTPVLTDTTAPQVIFNLNSVNTATSFTVDFSLIDPIDTVSPSGLANYVFRWREELGDWQEDLPIEVSGGPTPADFTRDFAGEDEKNYYFQVKAKDIVGNDSGWLPEIPVETKISVLKKILINEIYFEAEENKFFIELFNPSKQDIDLTSWYLQRKTETGSDYSSFITKTQFEGKKIGSQSYFLIVRQGSNFTEASDIITQNPFTKNNSLVLKNPSGGISDKLGFGTATDFETAPFLEPETEKSIGRKWIDGSSQDTENNFDDFEIQTPTPKAQNITFVEPQAPSDMSPPEVFFGQLEAIQINLNFTINFEITDPLETASPSGVADYIFRWKEESGEWNEDDFQNFSENPLKREFIGQDEKKYYFQIKATDLAGNESGWQPETPLETKIFLPKNILINEIQISPIEQRFVELYNPNDYEISLTGWYLQRKTKNNDSWGSFVSSTNFEGKSIPAKGYFIISRELLNSDILLNITLSSDNSLALKNSNKEIIDKAGWGEASDFEAVSAENIPDNKSITRNNGIDTNDNSADFIVSDAPTP